MPSHFQEKLFKQHEYKDNPAVDPEYAPLSGLALIQTLGNIWMDNKQIKDLAHIGELPMFQLLAAFVDPSPSYDEAAVPGWAGSRTRRRATGYRFCADRRPPVPYRL